MGYLLVMSFSGSMMAGGYMLIRGVMGGRISARLQYLLVKAAVLYYLVPLPFLKGLYGQVAVRLLPDETIEALKTVPAWSGIVVYANGKRFVNDYMKIQVVVATVWMLVALVMLTAELAHYLRTRQRLMGYIGKVEETSEAGGDFLERQRCQCRVKRKVIVCQNRPQERTMTFGFLRPVILCGRKIGSRESELILRHELIHIKRWDTLWKMLRQLAVFLNWWNPVAWILYHEFDRVCEWSCDEVAVEGRSKEEVKEYLRLLIDESKKGEYSKKNRLRWGIGFGNSARKIQERMENVMKRRKYNRIVAGVVLTVLVGANSLTALAYEDVACFEKEGDVVSREINEMMYCDDWFYAPDGFSGGQFADADPYMEEDVAVRYEEQFMDFDGNVYQIEEGENVSAYLSCNHEDSPGTASQHTRNSEGGCKVKVYYAQRCKKCGRILLGDVKNEITYAVCPH